MKWHALPAISLTLLVWASPTLSQSARTATEFGLNRAAKILCSGVFVSGRDLEETLRHSARRTVPESSYQRLASGLASGPASGTVRPPGDGILLDREARTVRVALDGYAGRARHFGDQGCVILPPGLDSVFFEPARVITRLPDAASTPWPMGDLVSEEPLPAGIDATKLADAVALAFPDGGLTAAFLVVHRGRIIAERYGEGADLGTQLESWSMGKSLTATLVGILAQEGVFGLDDPAPVPEWHVDPDDPRGKIRIRDLLQMSSGLRFTAAAQPRHEWGREIPDHLAVYADAIDAFYLSVTRPVEFPPQTVGRYRNSDPLTLGYIVRRTVEARGESYLTWPQRALFDKIGIRRQVMETDAYGNFLLTGHDYGTARNWARLGMLYLQDGVWNGERLLPDYWDDFVSTPAPAWPGPQYGGLFWVNGTGAFPLPESAYYMSGAGGQSTIIVPTHDLVVVRMGHAEGSGIGGRGLRAALARLMEALGSP
jgi:CubicO group peptidase (beta-lactamase class C family)